MPAHGPRLALRYEEWPEGERRLWEQATRSSSPFDEHATRPRSAKTLTQMAKANSLWLGYLDRHGTLDPAARPGQRITIANMRSFHDELAARVASSTVASRFNDLNAVIGMLDPSADRTMLKRALRRLQRRARPTRDKRARMVAPATLLQAGLKRMQRVEDEHHAKADVKALRYLDGLIMSLLACLPNRRGTLAAMELGRHLNKQGDRYVVSFDETETKNHRAHEDELPPELTPYIDRYLDHYRLVLLRGRASTAVWISSYRGPLSEQSHYMRFRAATKEELGHELCPHLARDIAATGIATERPELVGIIPVVLDHADERPAQKHYNHARKIDASRIYGADLLEQIAEARNEESQSKEE